MIVKMASLFIIAWIPDSVKRYITKCKLLRNVEYRAADLPIQSTWRYDMSKGRDKRPLSVDYFSGPTLPP